MNPTPANTAQLGAGTSKTSATAIVTAAGSTTTQRIDSFIKSKLSEADSADGSGILDSAARAARLGFGNSANARYSAFLEAFRSSPQLTAEYQESYPNSLFLPWPALHAVIKALDLRLDLPEHYMGAVPSEQLPWMEIFELRDNDLIRPIRQDIEGLLPGADGWRLEELLRYHYKTPVGTKLDAYWKQAEANFFVVAPPEAFRTKEDWLTRFRTLVEEAAITTTVAPPDPLVIRFCFGGCLVVAAWGDEAQALNEMTNNLNL